MEQTQNTNNMEKLESQPTEEIPESNIVNQATDTQPQYEDRHEKLDPYTRNENKKNPTIIFPSDTYSTVEGLTKKIDQLPRDTFYNEYNDEQRAVTLTNIESLPNATMDDAFTDRLNTEPNQFVNAINFGDKKLNTKILNITDKKDMSQSAMVAKLTSFLSVGDLIQVPLWHSGFWVTLKPPTLKALTNLDIAVASAEINLGRETSTLVYSNYGVVVNRIISEFIVNHIHETSLKLPEGEDIRSYILLPDYYLLVNGICAAMHPDGYSIKKSCRNSLIHDENNKPKCSFELNAVVDPKKLLFVDRKALNNTLLTHMTNRSVGSVSVDAVKNYQLGISELLDKNVTIHTNKDDVKFKMTLSIPTLLKHVTMGERWINDIIKSTEATYTDADTEQTKTDKLNLIINTCLLGENNTFIKSIELPDSNHLITSEEYILAALSNLSVDDKAFEDINKSIRDYINYANIAIIATPAYDCPVCGESNDAKGLTNIVFKDLVPLNMVEAFFDLSALRTQKPRYQQV